MRALIVSMLAASVLIAAPAYEHTRIYRQPDGSTFKGTPKGDEYLNWIEADNGDIVIYNKKTKQYEKASVGKEALQPSGKRYSPPLQGEQKARAVVRHSKDAELKTLWLKKRRQRMLLQQGQLNF